MSVLDEMERDNQRWTRLFLAFTLMKLTITCYLFARQMEGCKRGGGEERASWEGGGSNGRDGW